MLTYDQLQQALARIRLVVLDADGVLTDGGIFLGEREELKRYDVRDGAGVKYLLRHGIAVAVISGRESVSLERRCEEMGVTQLRQRQLEKLPAFLEIVERAAVSLEETAAVGDDLMELPLLRRAGVGIAVADACRELRRHADWVTRSAGGHGAVREIAEAILRAKGLWDQVMERYLV